MFPKLQKQFFAVLSLLAITAALSLNTRAAESFSLSSWLSSFMPATTVFVDDNGSECPGAYTDIQSAVNTANAGDTVQICPGNYLIGAPINIDKQLSVVGTGASRPALQLGSAIRAFNVSAADVTLDNLEIQKTYVGPGADGIIYAGASNFTLRNSFIHGPAADAPFGGTGGTGYVSRGLVTAGGITGLLVDNNNFLYLRQPAYLNPGTRGTISNNNVSGTRGFVVDNAIIDFVGNSFGPPANESSDVALLRSTDPTNYPDLARLSRRNNNAVIDAQYTVTQVSPGNEQGWTFADDNGTGTGSGKFEAGPGTPPLGFGSANLTVDGTAGWILYKTAYQGTRLDQIRQLKYSSYQVSPNPANAVSLQFNVDFDLTDTNDGYQGRIIYEPYQNGTVQQNQWQRWDATNGKFWASRQNANGSNGHCPQSNPCTRAELLGFFPNLGINRNFGAMVFKAGSGNQALDGNVDAFTIQIGADTNAPSTTFDFEGPRDCTSLQAPYNIVTEFSLSANPNCEFSYGNTTDSNPASAFAVYPNRQRDFPVDGIDRWHRDSPDPDLVPAVFMNRNAVTTEYFSIQQPPDVLNLHPGENGERSVVRFTAPNAGTYRLNGRFVGIDTSGTTSDAAITKAGAAQPLFAEFVNGFNDNHPFDFNVVLAAGDTVDFSVGAGTNGSYGSDSTGLSALISLVDTSVPSVTINQAAGQTDPAYTSPINFTVVFSEPVTGFDASDVILGGTANPTTATVTGSGTTYNVAVSGMSRNGTVTASIRAGAATDGTNNSTASTSTDSTVTYFTAAAVVTNTRTNETFPTIQSAIDDPGTANGDTLRASAGVYNERIVINKQLTIQGAQSGNLAKPRTDPGAESTIVVNNSQTFPIDIQVDNVTLDGFNFDVNQTFPTTTTSDKPSYLIVANSVSGEAADGYNNLRILNNRLAAVAGYETVDVDRRAIFVATAVNNIIEGNYVANYPSQAITLSDGSLNLIYRNNDSFNSVDASLTLQSNFRREQPQRRHVNYLIENNRFDQDGILPFLSQGGTIRGNTFNQAPGEAAILMLGGNDGVNISGNTFTLSNRQALLSSDGGFGFGQDSNINFTGNTVTRPASSTTTGSFAAIDYRGTGGTNTVSNNTVQISGTLPAGNSTFGIRLRGSASGNYTIVGNFFDGGNVTATGTSPLAAGLNIVSNAVANGTPAGNTGVFPASSLVNVNCNTFTKFQDGISVSNTANGTVGGLATAANIHINGNNFIANTQFGINNGGTSATIDAENNYWNAADGPGPVGPGSGDRVTANVDFDPFLTSASTCAPINTVPAAQTVNQNATLTFSTANGNAISIADLDSGTATVTLSVTNGTLTLSRTTGLTFVTGDGTADATMTFTGTLADINAALNGLKFMPTADFFGNSTLTISTTTMGSPGVGGGMQTDTDTVSITVVDSFAPTVTINQATGQSDPTANSPINFTVVFSEPVTDFATGDVTLSGTANPTTATVTGSGTTYNVAVSGMTRIGTVIATVAAGVAHDAAGNPNAASTSTDNTVTYNPPLSISGRITTPDGQPLAGVTITLSGSQSGTTMTDSNGNYTFGGLAGGTNNFLVTPTFAGRTFNPTNHSYTNVVTNVTDANFIAYNSNAVPRNLRIVNSNTAPGQTVVVPIVLTSQGDEAALSFSLTFNSSLLTFQSAACGADAGADCAIITNNSTPGSLGVSFDRTGTFAAGTREVIRITFSTTAAGNNNSNTPVNFSDTPTIRRTSDDDANPLPTIYTNGFVVFDQGLEADVATRFTGDGAVNVQDVVLMRQFIAGNQTPNNQYNEFQRADSAPRGTKGDGSLDVTDLQQTRRYAANIDSTQTAGGPAQMVTPSPTPVAAFALTKSLGKTIGEQPAVGRIIRAVSTIGSRGNKVTMSIELDSQGNEVGSQFSLNFVTANLSNPVVALGSGVPAGTVLTLNTSQVTAGQIGILLDSGNTFTAGTRQLVTVQFDVSSTATASNVTFGSSPTPQVNSDANANPAPSTYEQGTVTVAGPTAATVTVGGRALATNGRSIQNVLITLVDTAGNSRSVRTSASGNYSFTNVTAGETYVISAQLKKYKFTQPSQVLNLGEDANNVDFISDGELEIKKRIN